jgi:N-acetylmuramoyl-L-alanine amidase
VTVPALRVYVRETFYSAGEGECWFPGSGIAGLTFEIDGKAVTGKKATTNNPHKIAAGLLLTVPLHPDLRTTTRAKTRATSTEATEATVSVAGVADGKHVLKVIPDGKKTSAEAAGPSTSSTELRLYRPLSIELSLKNGLLTSAKEFDPADPKAIVSHGHVTAYKDDELCIDLKPDWIKTTAGVKARKKSIDLIVVHHTGGRTIGSALSEAISAKGPHYEIDPEGHVVKFVKDADIAAHAGFSCWDGQTGCNDYAIGIEIVHWQPGLKDKTPQPPVTEAQYRSLITLLKAIVKDHSLKPHRIVGHSDIRTTKADQYLLGPDRQTCPGGMFEWTRLEAEGLGMIPKDGVEIEDDWGGYFESYTDPLRFGDSDKKKVFGGKTRKDVSGVIAELQRDLQGIGYSVKVNGEFDEYTRQAVDRFKRHFFTGTRKAGAPKSLAVSDRIDKDTANLIVAIRMGLPGAVSKPPTKQGMLTPGKGDEDEGDHAYAIGGNGPRSKNA